MVLAVPGTRWLDEGLGEPGSLQPRCRPPIPNSVAFVVALVEVQAEHKLSIDVQVPLAPSDELSQHPGVGVGDH